MAKILMVEDDLELSGYVKSFLEFENHQVDLFHTGNAGRENLLRSQHDLVILDWEIPEVTGIEMLKEFREGGGVTPVLMLTGKDLVDDKAEGLDCGADDYLTKPFELKELIARVRALLRRRSVVEPKLPAIGDVRLDKEGQRALQSGRSVALTPREVQFLEFIAAHPSEHLSVHEYVQRVFNNEIGITAEVVRSTIMRLRKKLDRDGSFICPHLFSHSGGGVTSSFADENRLGGANPDQNRHDSIDDDSLFDDMDLLVGTTLDGKYELLELIGAGGGGLVYKAKHRQLGTLLAVKMLISQLATSADHVRRFKREAKTAITLSHQNILSVHDYGVSIDGQPYLVMELVTGESVADHLIKRNKLPVSEVVAIAKQACDGLSYAHQQGAIHRDVKPSNLMLVPSGESWHVKIVDFGLAKAIRADAGMERLTATGEVVGSPSYMSPEQCRGLPLDERTDVYSLGCSLFEMLTGDLPFPGGDPIAVLWKQVSDPAPHLVLHGVDRKLNDAIDRILQKCLAKEPDHRYRTVSELKQDLESLPGV